MIHLLFVVPYPELMEQVKEVVANHPEREKVNADVQALRVDEIPDIPGKIHLYGLLTEQKLPDSGRDL